MQLWSKDQFKLKTFEATDVFGTDEGTMKRLRSHPICHAVINALLPPSTPCHFLGLIAWMTELSRTGITVIKNVPPETDQSRKLADRLGFLRRTHYGEEYSVRADPRATNYSYTANPLQFHTDLPYYEYKPGVTVLHCISQTNSPGALSVFVDGFYVAERLRKENPKVFRLLTRTPVNWCDYGDDRGLEFIKILLLPIISWVRFLFSSAFGSGWRASLIGALMNLW